MGGELVKDPPKTNLEILWDSFPIYLSFGMTSNEYWDEDCYLAKAYREKDRIEKERKNQELWMQGLYIYDALLRVAPILHPFAKKGTRAEPYVEEPYSLTPKTEQEEKTSTRNEHLEKIWKWANTVNAKMREQDEQTH